MKILIEGMTSGRGGKESYIMNIFRAMNREGIDFTFIAYDPHIAYEDEIRCSGSDIVFLPPRNKGILRFKRELKNFLQNNNFDVIWAHKTTLSSCEILEVAKEVGIPIRIVHSHSSSNMGGKATYLMHTINRKRIFKIATHYLACSDVAAKWFYGNHDCTIVKNGFDLGKYRFNPSIRDAVRKKYQLNNNLVIGHVGRFGVEKNHIKLLEVFAAFCDDHENSKLVLCGDGEERHRIESKIKELNLENRVLLLGLISNVNEMLQGFDLIVMPSLFEGLPYSLLEAQAAGLKCVVSNTVSKESDILGWNIFVPLESSANEWAHEIQLINYDYDRAVAADKLKQEGFDINDCVNQIENIISIYDH